MAKSTDKNEKFQEPEAPAVAAPKNALVGDEAVQGAAEDFGVEQVVEKQPAQVTGPAPEVVDSVNVNETFVSTDRVITDPSSPEAVQIPDAGRGDGSLPIHELAKGVKPEDVFAEKATKATEVSDEDRDKAASDGLSLPYGPDAQK